jgi:hypothetical protein
MTFAIVADNRKRSRKLHGQCLAIETVGGNGAQNPWLALLFAGYGVGDFPESDRARKWICVMDFDFNYERGTKENGYCPKWDPANYDKRRIAAHPDMPVQFNKTRSVEDLRLAIAYNAPSGIPPEPCSWLELEHNRFAHTLPPTLSYSVAAKPPKCPLLRSLVMLYRACYRVEPGQSRFFLPHVREGIVGARYVPGLLRAYDAVCQHLTASCWHNKLQRLRTVIATAADVGGYLSLG